MKEDVTKPTDTTLAQAFGMWGCVLGGAFVLIAIGFLLYLTHGWSWP
jgi:hypothetical protein